VKATLQSSTEKKYCKHFQAVFIFAVKLMVGTVYQKTEIIPVLQWI